MSWKSPWHGLPNCPHHQAFTLWKPNKSAQTMGNNPCPGLTRPSTALHGDNEEHGTSLTWFVSLPGIEESVIGSSLISWTIWQLFPYGNAAKFTKMRPQRTPRGLSEGGRNELRGSCVRPRRWWVQNVEIRKLVLKDVEI